MSDPIEYDFRFSLDPEEFKVQRAAVGRLVQETTDPEIHRAMSGLEGLLDAIADQAHDRHGLDVLFTEPEEPTEQEQLLAKIEEYDSSDYDTEAMRMDLRNNNFSLDRVEEYRHENVVATSFLNGQFTQAKNQCREYGLSYDEELAKHRKLTS